MCGIIGSTAYKIGESNLNELNHRGPNSNGTFHNKDVSLGHTRLSIIDVENGQQPMVVEKGNLALVFNGEIYNYRELRDRIKNTTFKTDSDTEVLLEYYRNFGLYRTLEDINGMFSFAIYDNGKTILVRDRLGIKPLFYYLEDQNLSFCSELSPLKNLIGVDNLTINPQAVSMFFNTYYIASPDTIWNEIKSLEPGHYIKFEKDSVEVKKYWSLKQDERKFEDLEYLESLISDSVFLRMRSDVPYGAYLSGGTDSSLVVKHMSNHDRCKTFTAEIYDDELNERKYAEKVVEKCDTEHTNLPINYEDISLDFLRGLVKYFGQPFADSSIVPTYLISKEISNNVTVALGGDGADEVFCGYNKYNNLKDIRKNFFRNTNNDFISDKYNKDTYEYMLTKLPYIPEDKSEILRLLDIRFFLEGDILQKVDRLSMANSLEVRVPFLDHRIVEYSNSLTYDKLFGKIRKYPIKKILEKYFNKDFVHRSKIGFMLNVGEWIDNFDGWVSKSNALKTEVFVKNFNIKKVKDKYLKFAILMFCLWYEENYD